MKKHFCEISLHPLSVLYVALSILLGRFSFVFGLFIISFIHELFHCFGAYIFKIEIKEIKILPIGCFASIPDLENSKRFRQIIILFLGPFSFFFTSAIITFFYRVDFISIYGLRELNEINLFMMIFNLLPIAPLDGGKIIKIILSSFIDEKKSIVLSSIFSLVIAILFSLELIKIKQYLFMIFLAFYALKNILFIKKEYQAFILKRFISRDYLKYKIRLNQKENIYHFAHNFYVKERQIYEEDKLLRSLIQKNNREK